MGVVSTPLFEFDDTFVRELEGMYVPWAAARAPEPRIAALNRGLAEELGVDPDALKTPAGVALLSGRAEGTVAQAYAGHQFGGFSPQLGDGRALLLGEVTDTGGARRDIHLKGSGRTPFARGGDGKAVIGPMLREHVISEAMHALHVPTTRSLAVLTTGEQVVRHGPEPGAILVRVAASHLRVGTFQYAAARGDVDLIRRLADYAIARHHPDVDDYRDFFERVLEAQARLIAQWMLVGFVHGVMNTDNMTISGETIDYGPCAFMDQTDPEVVFSSIDAGGRYAYGNQPALAQWNLARLGETLLPLLGDDQEQAIAVANEVLQTFPDRYGAHWRAGMARKLGVDELHDDLADELMALLHAQRVDFTSCFRALSSAVGGDPSRVHGLFAEPAAFDMWAERWHPTADPADMDRVNPVYIPRNHLVEDALQAATAGDTAPFQRLCDVLVRPFEEREGLESYAAPAPADFGHYETFCGT